MCLFVRSWFHNTIEKDAIKSFHTVLCNKGSMKLLIYSYSIFLISLFSKLNIKGEKVMLFIRLLRDSALLVSKPVIFASYFSPSNLQLVASSNNTFPISHAEPGQSSCLGGCSSQSSTARGRQRGLKGRLGRSEDRLCRQVLVCAL